jgi:hypothetical protein
MRSVFLYLFLVGLPVLAISGVLRVGQRLRSPIFVGGTWRLERNKDPDSSCGYALINSERRVLTISQSGSRLLLTLNDDDRTTFAGEIRDATITATTARPASETSIDAQGISDASIQLHATVERESGSDRLLGALTFYDCATSAVTSFSAQRQAAKTTQGQ